VDVGERERLAVDHEAAGEHAVLDDEVADELAERRARPRDEALPREEPPTALTLLERLPVVELEDEVDELLGLFADGEELDARAREEAGDAANTLERPLDRGLQGARQL